MLDDILSAYFPNHKILAKPNSYFTAQSRRELRVWTYIFQVVHLMRCAVTIAGAPKASYIFREYDGFTALLLLLPFRVNLLLNANHNLNSLPGRLVSRILELRFRIVFIDPGRETLAQFKRLLPVSTEALFEADPSLKWDGKSVLLVCGSKPDQVNFTKKELKQFSATLLSLNLSVTVVGNNHPDGETLPADVYLKIASNSLAICTSAYRRFRNSGTLWFLKQNAPIVLLNASDCGPAQLKGHPYSQEFRTLDDALELVKAIIKEQSHACSSGDADRRIAEA